MRWSFAQNAAAPSSASSGTTIAAMMPPFELPSQFSEDPLEEPSFAQVAGAPTLGSGVSSLVDVSTSGSEVCSVVRVVDSVVVADSVVDWVVVVTSVVVASTLTEVVVGAADVVSGVRGADGSGASEVEGSADGSDVVDVVVGVATSTLTEVEGSTAVVEEATEVVSGVRVVDSAEAEGSSEVEVGSEDVSVEVGVSEVVGVVDEGDVVKLVEELGVGSFANSSSRFSCASLTRKKVRSRSACASLMSAA